MTHHMQIQNAQTSAYATPVSEVGIHSHDRVTLSNIAQNLNSNSSIPLHDQIFQMLKAALEKNQLEEAKNGRLPSLRTMSAALGVSRETVAKAISKLSGHGFISASERKRCYILPRDTNDPLPLREKVQTDFEPPSANGEEIIFPREANENNYLIDRYRKTLRKQCIKRIKLERDVLGLLSFREVMAKHLLQTTGTKCSSHNLVIFSDTRACIDFIVRLTNNRFAQSIIESPGAQDLRQILALHSTNILEIGIDNQGMLVEEVAKLSQGAARCFVSPLMQDPTGIQMMPQRKEALLNWAKNTNSLLIDMGCSHSFLQQQKQPSLWELAGGRNVIQLWSLGKLLSPWTKLCCSLFPDSMIEEVTKAKQLLGGEVGLIEQMALQDFILEGDLQRTQRHQDLLNVDKRRRISLGFVRMFKGDVEPLHHNFCPKMVFEVKAKYNAMAVAKAANLAGLPLIPIEDLESSQRKKLVLDLDDISSENVSKIMESLEHEWQLTLEKNAGSK